MVPDEAAFMKFVDAEVARRKEPETKITGTGFRRGVKSPRPKTKAEMIAKGYFWNGHVLYLL